MKPLSMFFCCILFDFYCLRFKYLLISNIFFINFLISKTKNRNDSCFHDFNSFYWSNFLAPLEGDFLIPLEHLQEKHI